MQFSVQRKKNPTAISAPLSQHVCADTQGKKQVLGTVGDTGTTQGLVHPLSMVPLKPWAVGQSKTKHAGSQQSVNFQGVYRALSPQSVDCKLQTSLKLMGNEEPLKEGECNTFGILL